MPPTVLDLAQASAALLAQIVDDLRWAHNAGFDPSTGTDPDRPAGRPLPPRDPDVDECTVPGPRLAYPLADHRLRQAYLGALTHLTAADRGLNDILDRLDEKQPTRLRPTGTSSLAHVLLFTSGLRWRLIRIALLTDQAPVDPPAKVVKVMAAAHLEIGRAYDRLQATILTGAADPDQHAVGDMCRICKIRPSADKTGGRCHTCHVWKVRNRHERPTRLDGVDDARQAHARRRARGEGHGDESFSATRRPA